MQAKKFGLTLEWEPILPAFFVSEGWKRHLIICWAFRLKVFELAICSVYVVLVGLFDLSVGMNLKWRCTMKAFLINILIFLGIFATYFKFKGHDFGCYQVGILILGSILLASLHILLSKILGRYMFGKSKKSEES